MNSDRIKEIQDKTGYTQSIGVTQALLQVWNECAQESEARISELENLLVSAMPEKDAEGIILKAKQTLGGEPGDSLIQLCIQTEYERSRYRKALEEVIANEEAYNRGDALSAHIAKSVLDMDRNSI